MIEKKSFHIDLLGYKMDYCFMTLHIEAGPICISATLLVNLGAALTQGWCVWMSRLPWKMIIYSIVRFCVILRFPFSSMQRLNLDSWPRSISFSPVLPPPPPPFRGLPPYLWWATCLSWHTTTCPFTWLPWHSAMATSTASSLAAPVNIHFLIAQFRAGEQHFQKHDLNLNL